MRVFHALKPINAITSPWLALKEILFIVFGAILMAIGTGSFLLPNQLSSGGFSGIATVLYYFFKIDMSKSIIFLNVPLFIIGLFKLGWKFILRTVFATTIYSYAIDISNNIIVVEDRVLASIYGGIVIGIGLAFILKTNTSTGGTDLLALILQNNKINLKVGNIIAIVDIIVVFLNLIAFRDIEIGLYSAISIFMIGKLIDVIFEGINYCKVLYIISEKYEDLTEIINKELKRGATGLYANGSYSRKNKMVIMCVSKRNELEKIKVIISKVDKDAFLIITDAREVYGLGFK